MLHGDLRISGVVLRGDALHIVLDGEPVIAYAGESVAAAMVAAGRRFVRWTAHAGEPRGYFCGMGVCHDCLVTADGLPNVRACMTTVREGQQVDTQRGLGEWKIEP